ncbi:hypothetical protein G4B88_003284 [Cannabis sativa]|uniref:Uncharacterized protein n=1 Tax=Cannabis sativa TaxID=3483 RepID=A0A7J6I4A8_CANSA|nr:hypothetical protein G4B88_003284 [Cannabis sativa]
MVRNSIISKALEENTGNETTPPTVPNLQLQSLMGEMRRMMREECEQIHAKLDRVEEGTHWRQQRNRRLYYNMTKQKDANKPKGRGRTKKNDINNLKAQGRKTKLEWNEK